MHMSPPTQFLLPLAAHPHVAALVRRTPLWAELLTEAHEIGARTTEIHPLVELLLGDDEHDRLRDLEAGLSRLRMSDDISANFSKRIVNKDITTQREAASALAELYVGGRLAAVGADVEFIPTQSWVTPDIRATRNGVTVTVEMASVNVSDTDRDADVADAHAFDAARGAKEQPILKRGEYSEHDGGVRILAKTVAPMGAGDIAQRVQKLSKKKTDKQLVGHPNPVLCLSFWHQFGVGRSDCLPDSGRDGARWSGELYAATYGRAGDVLFQETFKDEPHNQKKQLNDGMLIASPILSAVLWIFKDDRPVLFESDQLALDKEARDLLIDALDLYEDKVSRFRREPSHASSTGAPRDPRRR